MRNYSLRYIVCTLMCIIMVSSYGQEKFNEELEAIQHMTAHQAIYRLEQYQLAHPWFAGVYYHLGKANEELLPNIHPILNYEFLGRTLYNARVYYGNCIHYAQNSPLKNEDFVGLPKKGKHIEYADIVTFSRQKLDYIKQTKVLVENLYACYYRMVERYSECRRMFTNFCELYPGEKQAHLQLQPNDIALLNHLTNQFDSLQMDIQAFESALAEYPIKNYHPKFIFNDIKLYRLDGLTHTNFMDSTIHLWDYGTFAKQFLQTQHNDYLTYYHTIRKEYQAIENATQQIRNGSKQAIKTNAILTNYINKMDYASFMVPLTQIQQLCAEMINCYAQGLLLENDSTLQQEDIEFALNILYEKYLERGLGKDYLSMLESRISNTELDKYKHVFNADTTTQAILILAQDRLQLTDSIYCEISKQFYQTLDKHITPFEQYIDVLTDVVIHAHQLPQSNAEVVSVLPIMEGYLIVYADGTLWVINPKLDPVRQFEYKHNTPIKSAYKLSGNTIAIVTPTYISYIDNQGNLKTSL